MQYIKIKWAILFTQYICFCSNVFQVNWKFTIAYWLHILLSSSNTTHSYKYIPISLSQQQWVFYGGPVVHNTMKSPQKNRWFHRVHAPGLKLTFGLCSFIVCLVVPATNTVKVKVMSNEVGLRLLCCGMCFPYIYLFVATRNFRCIVYRRYRGNT